CLAEYRFTSVQRKPPHRISNNTFLRPSLRISLGTSRQSTQPLWDQSRERCGTLLPRLGPKSRPPDGAASSCTTAYPIPVLAGGRVCSPEPHRDGDCPPGLPPS